MEKMTFVECLFGKLTSLVCLSSERQSYGSIDAGLAFLDGSGLLRTKRLRRTVIGCPAQQSIRINNGQNRSSGFESIAIAALNEKWRLPG
jgi:hypothetical protein